MNQGWELEDWVILDNHYHIMVNGPGNEIFLSKFIAEYHKFTALFMKKNYAELAKLPKVFNNYWDTCITYERSYFARLNYLYNNPVKHGYVRKAHDYEWGSFFIRYNEDELSIDKLLNQFPCDTVNIEDDF